MGAARCTRPGAGAAPDAPRRRSLRRRRSYLSAPRRRRGRRRRPARRKACRPGRAATRSGRTRWRRRRRAVAGCCGRSLLGRCTRWHCTSRRGAHLRSQAALPRRAPPPRCFRSPLPSALCARASATARRARRREARGGGGGAGAGGAGAGRRLLARGRAAGREQLGINLTST